MVRPPLRIIHGRPRAIEATRPLTSEEARVIHEAVARQMDSDEDVRARVDQIGADWCDAYAAKDLDEADWLVLLAGRVGVISEQVSLLTVKDGSERTRRAARRACMEAAAVALLLERLLREHDA